MGINSRMSLIKADWDPTQACTRPCGQELCHLTSGDGFREVFPLENSGKGRGVGGQCVKGACNSRTGERESRVDPDFVLQSQRNKSSEEKKWQTCLTWPQKMNPMRDRFLLP